MWPSRLKLPLQVQLLFFVLKDCAMSSMWLSPSLKLRDIFKGWMHVVDPWGVLPQLHRPLQVELAATAAAAEPAATSDESSDSDCMVYEVVYIKLPRKAG